MIKTLIMEDGNAKPLIALCTATGKWLPASWRPPEIGAKRVRPYEAATTEQHTGDRVDGTSPFGTRRAMPMYCEESIAELPRIYPGLCTKKGEPRSTH